MIFSGFGDRQMVRLEGIIFFCLIFHSLATSFNLTNKILDSVIPPHSKMSLPYHVAWTM